MALKYLNLSNLFLATSYPSKGSTKHLCLQRRADKVQANKWWSTRGGTDFTILHCCATVHRGQGICTPGRNVWA